MNDPVRNLEGRARRLQRAAVVVDTVNRAVLDDRFFRDVRRGGITAIGRTILVSKTDVFSPFGFLETLREITAVRDVIDAHSDRLLLIRSGEDIALAKATDRVGIYVYFQSPEPLERQLWRLRLFYDLGLRVLQLTYNQRGYLGDGCAERANGGLSDLGVSVIAECERLGIAVDVSHCGDQTTMEALEAATRPVLMTHAMARALCDNRRCKTDEQIRRCAATGGVIGIQALPAFVKASPNPTVEDMLDHVDYMSRLVGVEHVGLGLDLTTGHERDDFGQLGYKPEMYRGVWVKGVQQSIPGMHSLADVPRITRGLLGRGYSDADVMGILGGNFARVLTELWRPASGVAAR